MKETEIRIERILKKTKEESREKWDKLELSLRCIRKKLQEIKVRKERWNRERQKIKEKIV